MAEANNMLSSDVSRTNPIIKIKKWLIKDIKRNYQLYIFLIPGLVYLFIFDFLPMYGVQIAFKSFQISKGIWGSPWVGFDHFKRFFKSYQFINILRNTLGISLYQLIVGFPAPIFLALVLNQVRNKFFKKLVQTVSYAPHFISVVVICGMIHLFLSSRNGLVNIILGYFGVDSIFFMGRPEWFWTIYVISGVWVGIGWGSIIYLAALTSVNTELYDAADIDGCNKLHVIWYIDIPAIVPTMVIMLILRMGNMMDVGFQKTFLLQNDLNLPASEVISTYVYKVGLVGSQYSYSTAIGFFNNVVNYILVVLANKVARSVSEVSLW